MRYAIVEGVRTARRAWPVAVILWAWSVLLAGPAAVPFFTWLHAQLAYAPEGDQLLQRFRFDLFAELTRSAQGPAWAALVGAVFAMLLVATVGRAFITGGLVQALSPDGSGPVLSRFFGGAGRWFLRNLAVLVMNGVAMALATVIVWSITRAIATPLGDSLSPLLAFLGLFGPLAAAGLVAVFFLIAFDYACIRVAQGAGVWWGWLGALWFVVRRVFGALGIWLAAGLLIALASLVYLAFRGVVPAGGWASIALMVAVQQLFVLAKAWVRVAIVASEMRYLPAQQPTVAPPVTSI